MTFMFVFAVFVSLACQGHAVRKKVQTEARLQAEDDCPHKIAFNPKDECIDSETASIVADHCCHDLRWCNENIAQISALYAKKIEDYQTICSLQENDLGLEDGKFAVVDDTRICEPTCKYNPVIRDTLPDYQEVENKCSGNALLDMLHRRVDVINVLSRAQKGCPIDESCPPEVGLSPRDECVDLQTTSAIADHCCHDFRWCKTNIARISDQYDKKFSFYQTVCELQEHDFGSESGQFVVVDNTRLCEPTCKDNPVLQEAPPEYQELERKCSGHEFLDMLQKRKEKISALDHAREACPARESCPPTVESDWVGECINSETKSLVDPHCCDDFWRNFYNYTSHFNNQEEAMFPDGKTYRCCCAANKEAGRVDCELKESSWLREVLGVKWGQGCLGYAPRWMKAIHYHSWNNLGHREEYQGLDFLGSCVVPKTFFDKQ